MSIQSVLGNLEHTVEDGLSTVLDGASSYVESVVGTVTTAVSNIYDGGFVGMSADGMVELKSAISKYCATIEELINSFQADGDITAAFKGKEEEAAQDFVKSIKKLLQAYVSQMRKECDEAEEAWKNWQSAAQSIASDINSATSDIRSKADNIKLD